MQNCGALRNRVTLRATAQDLARAGQTAEQGPDEQNVPAGLPRLETGSMLYHGQKGSDVVGRGECQNVQGTG